jgi:hypothetical protein
MSAGTAWSGRLGQNEGWRLPQRRVRQAALIVPLETVQTKTSAVLTDTLGERLEGLLGGLLLWTTWGVSNSVVFPPVEVPIYGASGG